MQLERGFRLGDWEVYPLRNVVSRAEASMRLEGKAIHVLLVLARHQGEVVSRRKLLEEVWHDRPVSDEVLSRCVSLLRSTLGDDPRDPAYIQTIPRTGYRLVAGVRPLQGVPENAAADTVAGPRVDPVPGAASPAPVETLQHGSVAPVSRAKPHAGFRFGRMQAAVSGLVLIMAVLVLFLQWPRAPERDTSARMAGPGDAIAVLPLRNLSANREDDYFADGLTDELVSRLSGLDGLKVIARTTALAYKGRAEDARDVGQKLGVSHLVTGTVRISDSRLRVTAQLVETGRGIEIASRVYDTTMADAFVVQRELSAAIVDALLPTLHAQGRGSPAGEVTVKPDARAYLLLLRARHLIKRRDAGSIQRAINLLEESIDLDPGQAPLYLALAKAHALLPYYSGASKEAMFARAEEIIETGRGRGAPIGDSAEGLAAFIALGRWEWLKADASFDKALAAQPSDADLYQWRSEFYASVGRMDLSLSYAMRASELDALSPVVNDRLAVAYLWLDQDQLAQHLFEEASLLGLGPTANPGAYLISLLRAGEYQRAGDLLLSIQSMLGGSTDWIDPLLAAQTNSGRRAQAIAAVELAATEGSIAQRFLFGAWIYLGEIERAMSLAEHMRIEQQTFDVEFLYARETSQLREHPRFGSLLARIGLDGYWDATGWPSWCRRVGGEIRCEQAIPAAAAEP